MTRCATPFVLVLCMLAGCDDPKSSLGELPGTSGSETAHATEASVGDTIVTSTPLEETAGDPTTVGASVPVTGEVDTNDVGAPCETAYFPQALLVEEGNDECASGICIFSTLEPVGSNRSCTTAEECGVEHAICNEAGLCQLDPAYVAERSMCTEACTDDADCVGVDGTTCETGFACTPVAQLGASCCQPLCVCRDDLDVEAANTLAQKCEAGTAEGCCDQGMAPEACGG